MKNIIFLSSLFTLLLLGNTSIAQDVEIRLGKSNIALNEYFTITIIMKNEQIKYYSGFPEIKGFVKRGVSNQSSTNIINGRMSREFSLVQNYQAKKEGKYNLSPFKIGINNVTSQNKGVKIIVGPTKQKHQTNNWDPFADLFGRGNRNTQQQEFVEVKDDAYFAVSTNKKEVYSGEGFNLEIAFYVAESNRVQMDFHDLSGQMNKIIKRVKPKGCW